MIVGNVYAKLKKGGNPSLPLLQNDIDDLFVPLAEKNIDGNIFGIVLRAMDSKLINDIAQAVYVEYSAPRNLNTNEKIKNWVTTQFQIPYFVFKNISSSEASNYVSTYVPSSKLWASIGDEYEKVKPAPMAKTITDSTIGLPSTDNRTWKQTFEVGDKVKIRIDFASDKRPYDSPENEFEILSIDRGAAKPYDQGGFQRPENPSGVLYNLSNNGGNWEGKDLELFGAKIIQPPVIQSKKHTIIGWIEKEEYIDYKTGKGVNIRPYPLGVNFDEIIAYLNGLANSKNGLDQIFIGNEVKDSVKDTLMSMFLNNLEIPSWSINGVKPYNLVIYKQDKPELSAYAFEAYKPEKGEIAEIKKVLGSDVDDEFASRVAAMDWKKISGLKKRNPELFAQFVETLATIFEEYKVEQGIDSNIVETISYDSDFKDELNKYKIFETDYLLGRLNITSFDNVQTSDQVTYYSFWGNEASAVNALIKKVANDVGGFTLQQLLDGETTDKTFLITARRMLKEQLPTWFERKVIVAVPSYKSNDFEKLLKEEAAKFGFAEEKPAPEPIPQPTPEEPAKEKEDLSQYTEIPLSWYNKVEVEDFGYDKITTKEELLDVINKKRRSKEDKIKLTLLINDVYYINQYDDKYQDFIDLYYILNPNDVKPNSDGVTYFLTNVKKEFVDKYENGIGYRSISSMSIKPSDEWIIDTPFEMAFDLFEYMRRKGQSAFDELIEDVAQANNFDTTPKPRASKKPKTEIQQKYEKIDFKF